MNTLKTIFVALLLCNFIYSQTSGTYDENPSVIQELERYYDNTYQYNRDNPVLTDDAWVGKNGQIETMNTFRLIYTWYLNIPSNATINSCTLYVAGTSYSNAQYPITNIQWQIKKFPDDKFNAQPSEQWSAITSSEVLRNEAVGLNIPFQGSPILDQTFLTYIQNSLSTGKLHVSIRETQEDNWGGIYGTFHYIDFQYSTNPVITALRIKINYTVPPSNVSITADNNFTAVVGTNHGTMVIDGVNRTIPLAGYTFPKEVGSILTLSANSPQDDNQGYQRIWHTGSIAKSNWTRDGEPKSNDQTYSFTVATDDDGKRYTANLRKNYAISRIDQTEFDGTVSAGVVTHIVEQNSGQISAPSQQTINGKNYKFVWWTDNKSSTNPRTINPVGNETYTTLYKYPHHSNDAGAYSNNSQRKFVKTPDNKFHIVYESMNKIWYEISTDGGSTWRLMNNNRPLNSNDAKNPSMDYNGNVVAIVYQEQNGTSYYVKLAAFYASGNDYIIGQNTIVSDEYSENYSTDANPVIGWGYNGRAMVVWARKTWPAGLYYKYAAINYNSYFTYSEGYIQNSTGNSTNPTIYHNKNFLDPTCFHLAWEEKESASISKIKYEQLYADVNNNIVLDQYNEPSLGSGYSQNYRPSITGIDLVNLGGRQEYEALSWIGYRQISQEEEGPMAKGTGGGEPLSETKTLFKSKYTTTWSSLAVYGNNVESISINKGSSIINYWEPYALAWSEVSGSITNKYIRSHETPVTIRTLNTTGSNIQINNSTNFYNLYVNSFSSSSLPYSFDLSESLSGGLGKTEVIAIFKGREGVVTKDSTDFYYAIGDITLDAEIVDFVDLPDTIVINNLQTMNEYLISEPFSVTSNSSLTYGVQYGITDSAASVAALSDGSEINFRIELIDNQSGEVLGVFDNVTFNSENVLLYNNIGYQVDLTGIGNRTLLFKLVVGTNAECDYSISKRFSDSETLNKSGYKQVSYKGSLAVTEYSLEQNYPNPFNPTTTIKYQIPAAGNVCLKIYDILGSEVATLVNEQQDEGRYEVSFEASNLASGVYIYRLQAGDFVDVKKMILLR